jgi:EXLDI family protein
MARMTIYVPDALAERVRECQLEVSSICQRALSEEITAMEDRLKGMENLEVEVTKSGIRYRERFQGRWLIDPRETKIQAESGAEHTFGIALTKRGKIAVYQAPSESWSGSLDLRDDLYHIAESFGLPEDLVQKATLALAQFSVVLDRDI